SPARRPPSSSPFPYTTLFRSVLRRRPVLLLRLGDALAQLPEGVCLRLAGGDDGVADRVRGERLAERRLQRRGGIARADRRDAFEERVPRRRRGERRTRAGNIGEDELAHARQHIL